MLLESPLMGAPTAYNQQYVSLFHRCQPEMLAYGFLNSMVSTYLTNMNFILKISIFHINMLDTPYTCVSLSTVHFQDYEDTFHGC